LQRFYSYDQATANDDADAVGYLTTEQLAQWLPKNRDVDAYFLGPKPFMALVKRSLADWACQKAKPTTNFLAPLPLWPE
jgi:nitric oxide dioxygenase